MAMPRPASRAAETAAGGRLSPSHPWPGLDSFAEADRGFFRGRGRESEELARLVRRESLTVLFGRSGLGKTSLLGAGLFPRLRDDLYLPVSIRLAHGAEVALREQVWQALAIACDEAGIDATGPQLDASLWEHFHRTGAGFWNARNRAVTPVLVFDQFEEVFTLGQGSDEARRRAGEFVAELADLIEDRPPPALRQALDADPAVAERIDFRRRGCKVVLSFREDFLAEMESLRDRMPSLMRNRYRLLPMDGHQSREVVDAGGELVADGVADRIIGLAWRNRAEAPSDDDLERMEVDPALLSVICSELNLRRIAQGSAQIGAALLAGAEREILVDFYERSLKGMDPRVRVFVEDELITEAGFRDSHALDDAVALPGVSRAAIDQLVEGRLLRVDDRFGVRRLELTHDVLTRVVKDSRDARQTREAEAAAAEREREALALHSRNRRNAAWIAAASVVAVLLLVGSGVAIFFARDAIDRSHIADRDARKAISDAAQASAKLKAELDASRKDAEAAIKVAERSANEALHLGQQAAEASDRANQQLHDSQTSDLMTNARATQSSRPDLALLLGAEAARRSPDRLDAQVGQLARLIANEGVRARPHIDGRVVALVTRPGGSAAVLGTDSGDLVELDLKRWQVLRRWSTGAGRVNGVAFDADGSRLVSLHERAVVAWRTHDATEIGRTALPEHNMSQRIVVAPAGNEVAFVNRGGVSLWSLPGSGSGPVQEPRDLDAADGSCLAFDAQGTLFHGDSRGGIASRRPDGTSVPVRAAKEPPVARSHDCRFDAVRVSGSSGPERLELLDAMSGQAIGKLQDVEADGELAAQFDPTGRFLFTKSRAHWAIWGTQPLKRLNSGSEGGVAAVMGSPDGRWRATALSGGEVTVEPAPRGAAVVSAKQNTNVRGFLFSPEGDAVMVLSDAPVRTVWRLGPGTVLHTANEVHDAEEVEFNRTGSVLATVSSRDAHLWDAARGEHLRTVADFTRADFSPDGSRLGVLRRGDNLELVDVRGSARVLTVAPVEGASVNGLAISWDNKRMAVARTDGSIRVHAIGTEPFELVAPNKINVTDIAFSPDGRVLAAAGRDGVVRLYRFGAGARVTELAEPGRGEVLKLVFSPDGSRLASGDADRYAVLHDVSSGQKLARFGPHDWPVNRLVFIENGEALVSGQDKGGRDVWDVRKGGRLSRLRDADGTVESVDISPRGRRVAVLRTDGTVSLRSWDGESLLRGSCAIANRNLSCTEWRQYGGGLPYRPTCKALPAPKCPER